MTRKHARLSPTSVGSIVSVSGANRKLLIKRLREIDKLSAKELAIIMADAEKIKAAFKLRG